MATAPGIVFNVREQVSLEKDASCCRGKRLR